MHSETSVGREGQSQAQAKTRPDQGAERESGCMGGRLPDCFAIRETLTPNTAGTCRPACTNCLWIWVVVGSCMFGEVLLLVLYNASPWYLCVCGPCLGEGQAAINKATLSLSGSGLGLGFALGH